MQLNNVHKCMNDHDADPHVAVENAAQSVEVSSNARTSCVNIVNDVIAEVVNTATTKITCDPSKCNVPIPEVTAVSETNRRWNMVVPVHVNERKVPAVVDTAADVTIISMECARSIGINMDSTIPFLMKGAFIGTETEGRLIKNIQLKIGKHTYTWDLVIAPIHDDMLLGNDFLTHHGVTLNLMKNILLLGEDVIIAESKQNNSGYKIPVSQVLLAESVTVPPNSVKIAVGYINGYEKGESTIKQSYVIESLDAHQDLLIPRVAFSNPIQIPICLHNDTSSHVSLRAQRVVGTCEEIDAFLEEHKVSEDSELASKNAYSDESMLPNVQVNQIKTSPSVAEKPSEVPNHLKELWEASSIELSEDQSAQLAQLLTEYADVFSQHDFDLGEFSAIQHKIDTGTATPVRQRMRRTPLGFEREEEQHLNKMLKAGVIKPSQSEWASAPVLIRKKDGSVRYCIDYRELNAKTIKDAFPLPLIEQCMDNLRGTQFFSTLDLSSGYWQIAIDPEHAHKTAFITKFGLYEHVRMGFGLCNAPATFQRIINLVLKGMIWNEVLAYIDDVIVMGKSFEEELQNLQRVFQRFREHNLKLKPRKCVLFKRSVEFLGKTISTEGICISESKVQAVKNWTRPQNQKDVESFLGFMNYHREFVPHFAEISVPLYQLTGKGKFMWDSAQEDAFVELKKRVTEATMLNYPSNDEVFVLDTDASDMSIGAELSQLHEDQELPIAFASKSLSKAQQKYCTTRKELLAIVVFTRQFRHYLLGRKFTLRTDHSSLVWLMRFKHPEGQLARWLEELSQYDLSFSL